MIPSRRFLALAAVLVVGGAACDRSGDDPARHRVNVERLDPRTLGADTLDPAFRVFRERCQGCHDVPAPQSKPAHLWDATVSRMKTDAAKAGLMPWSANDEAAIRRFLDDHASGRR